MENEIWKAVVGYEGLYEVSDQGRVRSLQSGRLHNKQRILKPLDNGRGYLQVGLYKDRKYKQMLVHRLVAQAFLPNPNCFETVNHIDEVKTNNFASNLEWMTNKDNVTYSRGRLVQMLDKSTNELLATFPSTAEAGRVTGIAQTHISACCLGKLKLSGGFIWQYAKDFYLK